MSTTRVRWLMRLAGLACVAAGLFPTTTRTGAVADGGQTISVPVLGDVALADQNTTTTFTLGLPASPLFRHITTTVVVTEELAVAPGESKKSKDGKLTVTGAGTAVVANYKSDLHWETAWGSVSGALVLAGAGLAVGAWFVGRRHAEPGPWLAAPPATG